MSDLPPRSPTVGRATPAPRRTLHVDGETWRVYEGSGSYDRRSRPTLIFESDHAVRRVRDFPPDWHELPDPELYALSWNR